MDKQLFEGSSLPENQPDIISFLENIDMHNDDEHHYDRRFELLSSRTKDAIQAYFNGDIDAAAIAAERAVNNFRRVPKWVLELNSYQRREWRA